MIPRTIKIGNIEYSVRFEEPKKMIEIAKENDQDAKIAVAYGNISYVKNEILLNSDLPESRMKEVLAHEVIHGLLFESGLDSINDEQTVDTLTHVLRRFMLENDAGWMK